MITLYYRNWRMIVLRGVMATVAGLIALILPRDTVVALATAVRLAFVGGMSQPHHLR
jgi:uncharacterized membrane protein HdeD (DUF308 family)